MTNGNKYPENIMRRLRQRLDLEPNDTSRDEELNLYSAKEAFEGCCEWEGFIGWSETILSWVSACWDISLGYSSTVKEDIYREMEQKHRMEDARKHLLEILILHDKTKYFEQFDDVDFRIMVARYDKKYDCNQAENDIWENIIEEYLTEKNIIL